MHRGHIIEFNNPEEIMATIQELRFVKGNGNLPPNLQKMFDLLQHIANDLYYDEKMLIERVREGLDYA